MKVLSQIVTIAVIGILAVPLAARFVPGTRPWLDQLGLLQPMTALGVVPASAAPEAGASAQRGAAPGGPPAGRGTAVIAGALQRQVMRDVVSAIGSARGVQAVDLSFEVTGRITALTVAPGDKVAAGDVIAELDAEAARLMVERARLVLQDAEKTLARLDQLAQSGTSTASQRQEAELARQTAALTLQSAERDLADHRLLAPIAGYVGLIEPQVGDLVSSSTKVTRIEDRSSLIVEFRVPERVAALVAAGDAVQATAVSSQGQVMDGRVVAVDNHVDEASRTLRVQATIANAQDLLRAGMAFQISLVFTGGEYPAVDPLAIQWGADGAYVWVVRAGKAVRVPIRILQRNAEAVLVEAAFEAADLVVTEGVQALRPGADVSVAES